MVSPNQLERFLKLEAGRMERLAGTLDNSASLDAFNSQSGMGDRVKVEVIRHGESNDESIRNP